MQKLMLVSRSNAVISVRRVAEVNAGRKTAGIDGRTALLASQKAELGAATAGRMVAKAGQTRVYPEKQAGNGARSGSQRHRTGRCKPWS